MACSEQEIAQAGPVDEIEDDEGVILDEARLDEPREARVVEERRQAQLVLRVHPAEVRLVGRESAERVVDALRERLGGVPPHVRIVSADSDISSYTLARMSRVCARAGNWA